MKNDDLTPTTLQEMTDAMLSEDFDKVTVDEFFGVLAAMDEIEQETIEMTGHIENGRLALDSPSPLPVEGNTIRVGNKRIVIQLREAA
jgi:hypothetical protein